METSITSIATGKFNNRNWRTTMIIKHESGKAIGLGFPVTEFKTALYILKALYKATSLGFIREAIEDLEEDMKPKAITFVSDHMCEHCKMMMNVKDPNCFNMITRDLEGKEESKWIHYQCPVLKQPYE